MKSFLMNLSLSCLVTKKSELRCANGLFGQEADTEKRDTKKKKETFLKMMSVALFFFFENLVVLV